MEFTVSLKHEKSTKGTHVYASKPGEGKPPAVKTLYVEKWALPEPPPTEITLTLAG